MKFSLRAASLGVIALALFILSQSAFAVTWPQLKGFVNDYAGVLTPQDVANIEQQLKDFESQTSNEIFVAIVSSFEGLDSFQYSQDLFNEWKIGKEGRNNGILFLWGPHEGLPFPERGDIFINVGPGLEGALPDVLTSQIIRNEAIPFFKEKKYSEGLQKALTAVMQATKGEYEAESVNVSDSSWLANFLDPELLIFLVFFGISYFLSFLARSKSWWLGGVFGGVGGFLLAVFLFEGLAILFTTLGLGGFGLFLDYIVSKNYQSRKKAGKSTKFWDSGGGFFGGSGGGFGGFSGGGGFSRGGGAGGSY